MPIFEYKCENCNHKYEILVKTSAADDEIGCPVCKSTEKKKLFSTFAASVSGGSGDYCQGGNCDLPAPGSCSSGFCGLN